MQLQRIFKENSGWLHLRPGPHRALIDIMARFPGVMQKAATSDITVKGFVQSGLLDAETKSVADFASMIGTVARPVTLQEEELCYATFGEMYHTHVQTGHLSDDVLLAAGFACDRGL